MFVVEVGAAITTIVMLQQIVSGTGNVGFTLQIYLDFSAYTDIAVGVAALLGLRYPQNFDAPLRAVSIGEFWRRTSIRITP